MSIGEETSQGIWACGAAAGLTPPAAKAIRLARKLNPTLQAFAQILSETDVNTLGSLGGVPYAAKDFAATHGRAPTLGLASAPGPMPSATAAVIEILAALGANMIGFTAMTELAYEPSGANAAHGRPLNPWSGQHICGGSSSGSAVAVAAGIVPVALGSDTAGSLRIPAHCCGVTAWKPAKGIVPAAGTMALAPSLDTIGFLAREASALLPVADAFLGVAEKGGPVKKVAVACDVAGSSEAEIKCCIESLSRALIAAGIEVAEGSIAGIIAACDSPVLTILQGEAWQEHSGLIGSGLLNPSLEARLKKGAAIDEGRLAEARSVLSELSGRALPSAFGDADAILLPVMRIRTPRVEVCEPKSSQFSARVLYELSALTRWVNGLDLPAVAIPAGFDNSGVPVAVQFVARRGWDRSLLELAAALQSQTDWHSQVPFMTASSGNSIA